MRRTLAEEGLKFITMGNIQSIAEADRRLTAFDAVSGTYDMIVTYVISQLIPRYIVEHMMWNGPRAEIAFALLQTKSHLQVFETPRFVDRFSGSAADGLRIADTCFDSHGIPTYETADIDYLTIMNMPVAETFRHARKHNIDLYLDVSQTYPGYAQVKTTDGVPEYLDHCFLHDLRFKNAVVSGPAISKQTTCGYYAYSAIQTTCDYNLGVSGKFQESWDSVIALPLLGWPSFIRRRDYISEMLCRHRLLQNDEQSVFYLVPVAHPKSKYPCIEWRISASKLESVFCRNLTTTQRQVYVAFKYLAKEATKECKQIKTYYLKTTLFWVLETTPSDVWHEDNLAQCLYFFLDKLIAFLAERNLPHYFIPENNLVGHLLEEELEPILTAMRQVRKDPIGHIMKFQKWTRLARHSIYLQNNFERSLLPYVLPAAKLLEHYKAHKQADDRMIVCATTLHSLSKLLDCMMLETCALQLIEGMRPLDFEKILLYSCLSMSLMKCSAFHDIFMEVGIPENIHENLYRFLMYLCKMGIAQETFRDVLLRNALHDINGISENIQKRWNWILTSCFEISHSTLIGVHVCLSFFKFMRSRLKQTDPMTEKLAPQRLKLAGAALRGVTAHTIFNEQEAIVTLDQCAVVFESLIADHKDIVTICEYLCFFTKLWHRRSSSVCLGSFVPEARKLTKIIHGFVTTIKSNMNNGRYRFHCVWKILSSLDELEPNLTNFLIQSDISTTPPGIDFYEIPHEIFGLFAAFLAIHKTLIPTAQKHLSKAERRCQCKVLSLPQKCDHSFKRILQELLKDIMELQSTIEKLFSETVNEHISHPLVKRFHDTSCAKFLLSLVRMYAGDWEGALVALPFIGQETSEHTRKKHEFAQKYANTCRFMIFYNRQVGQHSSTMSSSNVTDGMTNNEDGLLPNGTLYNINVDMASYSFYESFYEYLVEKIQIGDTEATIEANKIILKTKDRITTIPYDRKSDDLDMKIYFAEYGLRQDADRVFMIETERRMSNGVFKWTVKDMIDIIKDIPDQLFL